MYCNRLIPPENIELRKATNPLKSSKTPGVGGEGGEGRGGAEESSKKACSELSSDTPGRGMVLGVVFD